MRQRIVVISMLIAILSAGLSAQDQTGIQVDEIAICTTIENREPAGTDSVFSADVGKLYCYTKLTSQADTTEISHVWFFEDKEMAAIDLTMKAKNWRTWSSKTIMPDWKGNWHVEIHDSAANVITSIAFKIK